MTGVCVFANIRSYNDWSSQIMNENDRNLKAAKAAREAWMSELFKKMQDGLIAGEKSQVVEAVAKALAEGVAAAEVLNAGLLPGMDEVGRRFKAGDMFLPEVLRTADAMHGALDILRPELVKGGGKAMTKIVIGTVEGDLHDIGKNLVGMMFTGSGFHVVDLGIDVKPAQFVKAVEEHKPELLGLSALLTTTMGKIGETIEALRRAGLRDKVKVVVGGAPLSEEFAVKVGADGYGANAVAAVEMGRKLTGQG